LDQIPQQEIHAEYGQGHQGQKEKPLSNGGIAGEKTGNNLNCGHTRKKRIFPT